MKPVSMHPLYMLVFPALISATSVLEALNAVGATSFAQEIQADPALLALYTSSSVRTVYAVPDVSYSNATLRRRQNGQNDAQVKRLHASSKLSDMESQSLFPGDDMPTNADSPDPPSVVSEAGINTNSSTSKHRRQYNNGTVPSTPVKISSGLGNKVNIIRGDIPYDGGIIHLVDNFFTVPVSVSETINSTGLSTLQTLLTHANLSNTFTNSKSVTIFTPSDEAFAAAGSNTNTTTPELQNLLLNHIVPDFKGYLPELKDGANYTTMAGSKLTITVRNNAYFVNGARITSPNTITDNGVAHVINGVLTPSQPPYTGAGWALRPAYSLVATIAVVLLVNCPELM
ncbi:hypothetical protein N0V90_007807 [Kalmusia sp. IMI 367209]|nr:hypothetical protein N0V90_007807 [Kalmusia sp. IMI 367209]